MKDILLKTKNLFDGYSSNDFSNLIKEVSNKDVAIIGIGTKLPMAENADEYWENIVNGLDCVIKLPENRCKDINDYMEFKGVESECVKYTKAAFLKEFDMFDYSFFKITPKEAQLINPEHRIFLETVWAAIEDAGYGGGRIYGSNTGVYIGFVSELETYKYTEIIHQVAPYLLPISALGTLPSLIAGRICYLLDLKGPSILIDGACSSSLISVHMACQAIRNKECEMAIAGGVRVKLLPIDKDYYKMGMESSDYITRTFDENADGMGEGEGSITFVLKSYEKAKRDRDNIYAIIKGSAINQDGNSLSLTVPNAVSQADVIIKAWENAGVNPESISYIEAHGTGTKLGDSVEVQGIQSAFKKYTDKKQFCAISSVKSNIGHLYGCSGAAGLLKAIMSLKNKSIPPSINFNTPNSKIDFIHSPIYVNTKVRKWGLGVSPRRCGISSFGINGSNSHLILEEAQYQDRNTNGQDENSIDVFTLSAKSEKSLFGIIEKFKKYFNKDKKDFNLHDVCYTANTGRWHYEYRVGLIVNDKKDFLNKINILSDLLYQGNFPSWLYYRKHKVISERNENYKEPNEIIEIDKLNISADANRILEEFIQNKEKGYDKLSKVCELYISGADVNWNNIYINIDVKKVSLPTYYFDKKRCWLEINEEEININYKQLYYLTDWIEQEIDNNNIDLLDREKENTILIFADFEGKADELSQRLSYLGNNVIRIYYGHQYRKVNSNHFIITGNLEEFKMLSNEINIDKVSKIVHLSTLNKVKQVNSIDSLKESQKIGMYSIFNFIKAFFTDSLKQKISFILISEFVNRVSKKEKVFYPENATLFGIGKTISREYPFVECKCIDADNNITVENIYEEICYSSSLKSVAYRNGRRYIEIFKNINIDEYEQRNIAIKEEGIYVITGGTGGIVLETIKTIASKAPVKLALLNRSIIPSRDEWDFILEKNDNQKLCNLITNVKMIEKNGSKVFFYSINVSDFVSLERLLDTIRKKFERINGIIHAAGVADYQSIAVSDKQDIEKVLMPKIYGTWALDKLTEKDNLDFFIMFSSVSTIFYAAGLGAYTAANSYMDSYAYFRNAKGKYTQVINWTTWKEVGMAFNNNFNIDTIFKAMPTKQAVQGFENIFGKEIVRVLIGEINCDKNGAYILSSYPIKLTKDIQDRINNNMKKQNNMQFKMVLQNSDKVVLKGRSQEDYSKIEIEIAKLCKDVMGFSEININESFFQLGADSILIKKFHEKLKMLFPGKVSVADIFEYSTIFKLSKYIAEKQDDEIITVEKNNVKDDIKNLFEQLEQGDISIDNALDNLNNM